MINYDLDINIDEDETTNVTTDTQEAILSQIKRVFETYDGVDSWKITIKLE